MIELRIVRCAAGIALLLLTAWAPLGAQSTATLPSAEPRWRVEASVGTEPFIPFSAERVDGETRSAVLLLAARRRFDDAPVGIRPMLWWAHHHLKHTPYGSAGPDEESLRLLSVGLATDVVGTFGRELRAALSVGAGIAPHVRSTTVYRNPDGTTDTTVATSTGWQWGFSLAARYKRLVVEQHAMILLARPRGFRRGEFSPLTVGIRF